jgi:uncharacterized lipoprotein YehR (DUF1307 family)
MIKLVEAQRIGTTGKDTAGRTVAQSSFIYRDLFVNPEHIVSINEEFSNDISVKLTRVETTKGSFLVVGTALDVQKQFSNKQAKKILKD